jgi:uncharacterized Rmd1/YagE family protein
MMHGPMAPSLLSVHAFAVAATLAPADAERIFAPAAARIKVTKTLVIVRYGPTSWAVAHDFGALVFVDVPEAERKRVLAQVVGRVGSGPRPPAEETFSVELAPGATPSALFDRVIVGDLDARTIELISLVIGQSVGMEYYEDDVDLLVGEIVGMSQGLAATGRFRARARELLAFVGRAMTTRTQVVYTLALLDAPVIVWDSEALDRVYRDLRVALAIEDRYRGLDQKLAIIRDNLELLVDLTRHRRSTVLEVAVIVLIAVEIVLATVQLVGGR